MIRKRKETYQKPNGKEKSTVYPFNNNKEFDVVTRKYSEPKEVSTIGQWVRIKGNKMKNTVTGAERPFIQKDLRKISSVCGALKVSYRTIKNEFSGKPYEYIIVFEFNFPITDVKILNKHIKNIKEKLIRKFGEIVFVRILVYIVANQPIIHFWIRKPNNEKLELDKKELETLWGYGKVSIIQVTKNNVKNLASYYCNSDIDKSLYPTGIKVWSTSTNIKEITPIEDIDRDEVDNITKGCNLTYGKSIGLEDTWTGDEIQHLTYESFERLNALRLSKVPATTKYTGTIVRNYKKRQKEKADKNFAEIEKLTTENNCWFEVERIDTDLCRITVKKSGKVYNTLDTRQTLKLVEYLINK